MEFSAQKWHFSNFLKGYSVRSSEVWWWNLELFWDCPSDFTEILSCVFGHSYFAKEDEKPTVAKAEDEAIVGFADGIYSLFWSHHIEKAMSSEWKNVEIERWWWPIAFHPRGALRVLLGSFIEWVDSIHDVRICFALKPFGHVVVLFALNKVCVYNIRYNMSWYIDI